MSAPMFMSVEELPPRPDPNTGEPRPPIAPEFRQGKLAQKSRDADQVNVPSAKPSPPPGQGPALVWYQPSRHKQVTTGLTTFFVLVIGVTVIRGFDPSWMAYWLPWVVLIAFTLLMAWLVSTSACSVGADWLKVSRRRWVRLYDLAYIKTARHNTELYVEFKDHDGRYIDTKLEDLQQDRGMWDLIYNGILHSIIVGGAESTRVHNMLNVPYPHATKEQ